MQLTGVDADFAVATKVEDGRPLLNNRLCQITSFRYDDFARSESELIEDRGCRRVTKCRYDNNSMNMCVRDTIASERESYAYDDEGDSR